MNLAQSSIRIRCVVTSAVAWAIASSACVDKDRSTQITIALAAETSIPRELDTVEVVVRAGDGSEIYRSDYPVTYPRFFPTTLAIVPRDDDSLDRPVTIEVRGYKAATGSGQVFRRAVVPFFKGRTLLVPMPLRMACFDFTDCGADQSCAGGRCVPALLDATKLADFDEARVFGSLPDAACFDEAACLGVGTTLPIAADCTFALPPGPIDPDGSRHANVAIRWAAAPSRVIGLDGDDAVEGWTRVDDVTGKLSPGVCDSLQDPQTDPARRRVPNQALEAQLSIACATKTHDRPYCPAPDGHTGIGTANPP